METQQLKPKICIVAASPFTIQVFMLKHLQALAADYKVTVICNTAESAEVSLLLDEKIRLLHLGIERDINPWRDLVSLVALLGIFRRERFMIVHTVTPKAGLLAQIAAGIAGVPHRIHTFTGQVWVTRRGVVRRILRALDRFYAACATDILVDSPSQRDFLVNEGVLPEGKGKILGLGSISGVDVQRFLPNPRARKETRGQLGVSADAPLFLYLGRLKRDKGLLDLAAAFAEHARQNHDSHLLVVGPDEEQLAGEIKACCAAVADRVHLFGYTAEPERYMAAADVLCLPSYREGFGSVILEAAACGLPTIASRIFGITDAIVEGQTGLLHTPGEPREIAALLSRFAENRSIRETMGAAARRRAVTEFSADRLTQALLAYYQSILAGT